MKAGTVMALLLRSPLFSEELGIRIAKNTDGELFKWFLAGILFGARISETIARLEAGLIRMRKIAQRDLPG